jgi:hypothetical protein
MTLITREQARELAEQYGALKLPWSENFVSMDFGSIERMLTDFAEQVIADLARRTDVMPQIQDVGTRHWSELICIPDEVRESIASLQAKLEQSEALVRELEKDAARLDALERNVLECRGKLQIACTPGNFKNLLDGVINDYAAIDAALNKESGHEA